MLACHLMSPGWRAEQAIAEVRAHRPGSIMLKERQTCVAKYEERLKREHSTWNYIQQSTIPSFCNLQFLPNVATN